MLSFYPLPCLHYKKLSVQMWTLLYTALSSAEHGHSPFPSGVEKLRAHIRAQPFILQVSGEQPITERHRAGLGG